MGTILGRAAGPSAGRGKHQTTADDFAELGWEVLRVSETAGALPSVEIDFALAHPDFGVALVDVLHAHPEPVKRLRDRLDAIGFSRIFPGHLPIIHRILGIDDLWRLSNVLEPSFMSQPRIGMPGPGWIGLVQQALLLEGGTAGSPRLAPAALPIDWPVLPDVKKPPASGTATEAVDEPPPRTTWSEAPEPPGTEPMAPAAPPETDEAEASVMVPEPEPWAADTAGPSLADQWDGSAEPPPPDTQLAVASDGAEPAEASFRMRAPEPAPRVEAPLEAAEAAYDPNVGPLPSHVSRNRFWFLTAAGVAGVIGLSHHFDLPAGWRVPPAWSTLFSSQGEGREQAARPMEAGPATAGVSVVASAERPAEGLPTSGVRSEPRSEAAFRPEEPRVAPAAALRGPTGRPGLPPLETIALLPAQLSGVPAFTPERRAAVAIEEAPRPEAAERVGTPDASPTTPAPAVAPETARRIEIGDSPAPSPGPAASAQASGLDHALSASPPPDPPAVRPAIDATVTAVPAFTLPTVALQADAPALAVAPPIVSGAIPPADTSRAVEPAPAPETAAIAVPPPPAPSGASPADLTPAQPAPVPSEAPAPARAEAPPVPPAPAVEAAPVAPPVNRSAAIPALPDVEAPRPAALPPTAAPNAAATRREAPPAADQSTAIPAPPDVARPAALPPTAAPSAAATGRDAPPAGPAASAVVLPAQPRLPQAVIDRLMARGDEMLTLGDISAARLFYGRAAAAGSAAAARAMGRSFDPDVLNRLGVRGIRPDPEQARQWYQRAEEAR